MLGADSLEPIRPGPHPSLASWPASSSPTRPFRRARRTCCSALRRDVLAEPVRAFANMRRLRPGARVTFCLLVRLSDNPWFTTPIAAASSSCRRSRLSILMRRACMYSPDLNGIAEVLGGAGFADIAPSRQLMPIDVAVGGAGLTPRSPFLLSAAGPALEGHRRRHPIRRRRLQFLRGRWRPMCAARRCRCPPRSDVTAAGPLADNRSSTSVARTLGRVLPTERTARRSQMRRGCHIHSLGAHENARRRRVSKGRAPRAVTESRVDLICTMHMNVGGGLDAMVKIGPRHRPLLKPRVCETRPRRSPTPNPESRRESPVNKESVPSRNFMTDTTPQIDSDAE